jgi:hypothetical protein
MRFVNQWTIKNGLLLAGCITLICTTGCQWAQTSWDATRSGISSMAWWQKDNDAPSARHEDALMPPSDQFNPGQSRMASNTSDYGNTGSQIGRPNGYPPSGSTYGSESYQSDTYSPRNSGNSSTYDSSRNMSGIQNSAYGNSMNSDSSSSPYGPTGGYSPSTNRSSMNSMDQSRMPSTSNSGSSGYGNSGSGYGQGYSPSNNYPSSSSGGFGSQSPSGYSPQTESAPLKVSNPYVGGSQNTNMGSGVQPASATQSYGAGNSVQNADYNSNYQSTPYNGFEPRSSSSNSGSNAPMSKPPTTLPGSAGSFGSPVTSNANLSATSSSSMGASETWTPGSTNSSSPTNRTAALPGSSSGSSSTNPTFGGGGSFDPGR